jgi:hypothetical protein
MRFTHQIGMLLLSGCRALGGFEHFNLLELSVRRLLRRVKLIDVNVQAHTILNVKVLLLSFVTQARLLSRLCRGLGLPKFERKLEPHFKFFSLGSHAPRNYPNEKTALQT